MLSFCKYSVSACKQNFLPKRKTSCRVKNIIWKYYKPICSTIPQSFLHRSGWKPAVHPVLVSALSGIPPQRVQMQNATTGISVQTFKPVCQLYWNTTWKKPHESSSAAKPNMQKQLLGFFTIPSYFSSSVYPLPHSFLPIPSSWTQHILDLPFLTHRSHCHLLADRVCNLSQHFRSHPESNPTIPTCSLGKLPPHLSAG